MSSPRRTPYKHVDVGRRVLLNDQFLLENDMARQQQAHRQQQIQAAEDEARAIVAEAHQMIESAREEALIQANAVRDEVLQAAYQEGFDAGYQAGYQQVGQDLSDRIQKADTLVQTAFSVEHRLVTQHQGTLRELLMAVLSRVLPYELATTPEQLGGLLESAVSQLQCGQGRIVMHPETLEQLKTHTPQVCEALQQSHHLALVPDTNCSPFQMYLQGLERSFDLSPLSQAQRLVDIVATHVAAAEAAEEALSDGADHDTHSVNQ